MVKVKNKVNGSIISTSHEHAQHLIKENPAVWEIVVKDENEGCGCGKLK